MNCKGPKICAGALRHSITIERRALIAAEPGSAEPVHSYTPVLAPRAEIKTRAGASEWSRVEINGTKVSHVITIRYTAIAFDIRDRVRDYAGNHYTILAIENVDEASRWLRLHCARAGDGTAAAVA